MSVQDNAKHWMPGVAPVAVVMISLNEAHNMEAVLSNLKGWAQEVFLVDSHSADETVDIALRHGVHVVQRRFHGFGDQWNFALRELPITAPWTMKLDPDERLSNALKRNLTDAMQRSAAEGFTMQRRLWFMGRPLPVRHDILRAWKTGRCRFSDVLVNEHPLVDGAIAHVAGDIEHHDSPDLEHWLHKQNKYSSAEAIAFVAGTGLAAIPKLLGNAFEKRMWVKRHFFRIPFRYVGVFCYYLFLKGVWRAGKVGCIWARLRSDVYRYREYKVTEMRLTGRRPGATVSGCGRPDARVPQFD
ncbi:glycosyltransferase family 2 protein [Thermomonas sp.]|uniref:glycosyltransferase family 2 protein n=1 Tax=Thermomonas sp. TaxID=1971895 RepID=UPI0035B14EBA